MGRLNLLFNLIQNMGWEYMWFRVIYEFKRKTGWLKKKFPVSPRSVKSISLNDWQLSPKPFLFQERDCLCFPQEPSILLEQKFKRILEGEICFFHGEWKKLEKEFDWVTNPDSGFRYDVSKHWTQVEDFVQEAGDIKYVWEKSRFTYLYLVLRYDYHHGKDHAEFVFNEIADWMKKNPVNQGPNYKCSQEISLRVLNWIFAIYFYKDSKKLMGEFFDEMIQSVYWQINHVFNNIQFSRKAVRNNHAITETLSLYLVGMLFPSLPDAEKWKKEGKRWFEQEIEYQIAEDGTYLQFSMNYHRVVVQLFTLAIALSDRNGERFSDIVYQRAYASLNFLYQCQDKFTGWLPNYGANDGALFFDLNDDDYRNYRPQLNALHYLLTGEHLYESTCRGEDVWWYISDWKAGDRALFKPLRLKQGAVEFPIGGYYLIRESEILTFIRCGKYRNRPSHADNLHVDVWWRGENILMDGGSFKYNTQPELIRYFSGTASHNTVMLDGHDQMLKGPRFIWLNWSRALEARLEENGNEFRFEGAVSCFMYLNEKIVHKRIVRKKKGELIWEVTDEIVNKPVELNMRQLWHTQSDLLEVKTMLGENIYKEEGAYSSLYGMKEKTLQYSCVTSENQLQTIISIVSKS